MKKVKYVILGLLLLLLPFNIRLVGAETIDISLDGVSSIKMGEQFTYEIVLNTDLYVTAISAELKFESDFLELASLSNKEDWNGQNQIGTSGSTLNFTSNGVTGETSVAGLKFKVKANTSRTMGNISLENINITVKDSETGDTSTIRVNDDVVKTINIKSTDNTLSNIKIDDKNLTGFTPNTDTYTYVVESTIEKVKIAATLTNNKASFVTDFGPREVTLEYGDNEVLLKVMSEAGTTKIYTLTITREDERGKDNFLKTLIVKQDTKVIFDSSKDDFSSELLEYSIKTYKITLTLLDVITEASDLTATVKVEYPKEIVEGKNEIIVSVTSESGDIRNYVINLYNSNASVDTTLKSLTIKNYDSRDIEFDKNNSTYELVFNKGKLENCQVDGENYKNCLKIYAVRSDINNTEIKINGNYDLSIGSIIEIVITGADGSSDTYTLTMIEDRRVNFFFLLELLILIALIILLVILVIKRYISNKKNRPRIIKKKIKEVEPEPEENVDASDFGTIEITKEVQEIKELTNNKKSIDEEMKL